MRIGGLATGMDTEQIIKDMMTAHRIPLDKITQKKQYLQWQLDDYRSFNRNLRDTGYKVTDTVGKQATFMQKTVNVSNPDAVGVKGAGATGEFSGTIEVKQLATQSSMQSKALNEIDKPKYSGTTKLSEIDDFDPSKTLNIQAIDKDGNLGEIVTVTFDATDTIDSAMKKISKETGVNAFYDEFKGQIALTAKNSGALNGAPDNSGIQISGDLASVFKLDPAQSQSVKAGVNAKFTFNGLETERTTNNFNINGFEINLKQVTTGPVTFSSSPDVDKVLESVTKFVDDYNKLIEELHAKIKEPVYRNFQPLSDEQKKDMKEKEIELWEEKAKSGTLRNDPTISSMLTKMRQMMSEGVETSTGKVSLKDLGITPIKDYKENGKLEINETELRKAISEDPNKVYEVFAKTSTATDKGGIAIQFRKTVDETNKVISTKAGSTGSVSDSFTLGRTMKSFEKQIERFEDRLKMTENRLWKQFTAMENAIQRANAQSASLASALGGGM